MTRWIFGRLGRDDGPGGASIGTIITQEVVMGGIRLLSRTLVVAGVSFVLIAGSAAIVSPTASIQAASRPCDRVEGSYLCFSPAAPRVRNCFMTFCEAQAAGAWGCKRASSGCEPI